MADAASEDDSHQGVLHGWRGGVHLVEEHQALAGMVGDLARPRGRLEHHPAGGPHGQPGEVGRLVQGRDHRLGVPAGLSCEPLYGLGFAGAGVAPQKHRHPCGQKYLHRAEHGLLGPGDNLAAGLVLWLLLF